MKAVLLSIQPKWCEKIARGIKTIEIRKRRLMIDTSFKCFVCNIKDEKVIGEFVCDKIDKYISEFYIESKSLLKRLGVVYEDIRKICIDDYGEEDYLLETSNERDNPDDCELLKSACWTFDELKKYVGNGNNEFYAWHISELKIYDQPKQVSDFYSANRCRHYSDGFSGCDTVCSIAENNACRCGHIQLRRPPQTWQYVEV